MTLTRAQITRLQKYANGQPASDAILIWFFVWIFISCCLFWVLAARAFPEYDGAQGVSLAWVGALLTVGGLIAACLCWAVYNYLLDRKQEAIAELRIVISDLESNKSTIGKVD